MSVVTLEAIVEDGEIRLPYIARQPDRTKVYVVVPGLEVKQVVRLAGRGLARPAQAADFVLSLL